MKVLVIYGTEHRGSTFNIVKLLLNKLSNEISDVTEMFLPKAMPHFCCGCSSCFVKGEDSCPHYNEVKSIKEALEKAEVLIFASPVYVYHTTGQMKTLLDHFGFQWMVHRPNKTMFSKIALVVSTAAGAGMKSTNKDITDSLSFWGVGKIYTYGKAVAAVNWEGVPEKKKLEIDKDIDILCKKIIKKYGKVTPSLKVKTLFYVLRFVQKKFTISPIDKEYWEKQGWLRKNRPWGKS